MKRNTVKAFFTLLIMCIWGTSYGLTILELHPSSQGFTDQALYTEVSSQQWGTASIDVNGGVATITASIDPTVFALYYDVPLNVGLLGFESSFGFGLDSINVLSGTPVEVARNRPDHWDYSVNMGRDPSSLYQELVVEIVGLPLTASDSDFLLNNELVELAYGISSPILVGLLLPTFGYNEIGMPPTMYLYAGQALSSSVPEPASIALMSVGLAALGFSRRKNEIKR